MIYTSIELIPAKIFFRIQETNNLTLLTDEENVDKQVLAQIWEQLKEQNGSLPESEEGKRTLSIATRLEMLNARLESVTLATHHLKSVYDQELMDLLISKGYFPEDYKFTDQEQLVEDLKRVDREAEAIQIKINLHKDKLPKDDGKKKITFDQSVMGYSAFTGSGFIDPNTIALTQYYALINLGAEKIKALENGKG